MYKIEKWNSTVYFGRKLPLSLSDYHYHLEEHRSLWYKRTNLETMLIDLNSTEEELLRSYKYALRYDIKKAYDEGFDAEWSSYSPEAIKLFSRVVKAHDQLVPYPQWLLKGEHGKYYSEILHPDYGLLAAHLHIYDVEEKRVLLLVNASDFRSYEGKLERALVARANKLLFHQDFLYFKKLGAAIYDMGGYTEATKSFKRLFNGEIAMVYNYEPRVLSLLRKTKTIFR